MRIGFVLMFGITNGIVLHQLDSVNVQNHNRSCYICCIYYYSVTIKWRLLLSSMCYFVSESFFHVKLYGIFFRNSYGVRTHQFISGVVSRNNRWNVGIMRFITNANFTAEKLTIIIIIRLTVMWVEARRYEGTRQGQHRVGCVPGGGGKSLRDASCLGQLSAV